MRNKTVNSAIAAYILTSVIFILIISNCNDREITLPNDVPMGEMLTRSDCRVWTAKYNNDFMAVNDCIEYKYHGDTLILYHINAGLNCCPDSSAKVYVRGDTIEIDELPIEGHCHCLCLYELVYQITNLPEDSYHLLVKEQNIRSGDSAIEFNFDLKSSDTGLFCLQRDYYPWSVSDSQ
jgi:hypothetical protein